mmetsp:Transcript_62225/g.135910  ORF Transcript_62225/g.135910 Transcript_62225/m.135910 type:complete len:425 (+) Transcript_62225:94-1368(+)
MTEFRKASGLLERIETLVSELLADASLSEGGSAEAQTKYQECQKTMEDISPVAEKMQKKVEARLQLQELQEKLSALLPNSPDPETATKVAQETLDASGGGEAKAELAALLSQAHSLEGQATYGKNMMAKVTDLLGRLQTARTTLGVELAPKLGDASAAAAAAAEAQRLEEARIAAEKAAEEERLAREEERKIVEGLMAANAQRIQEQSAQEEAERRAREQEEESRKQVLLLQQAEEEALMRALEESERTLKENGKEAAVVEALSNMLAASCGDYRALVEALSGLLGGIASEPQDARLRTIRVANEGFQTRLGRRPGVWLFLRAVGFEVETRSELPAGLISALGLPTTGPPSEKFLMMKEPDIMNAHEEWCQWHEKIKALSRFLSDLERLVFQRTAHLGQRGGDLAAHTVLSAREVLQGWEAKMG